MCPHVLHPVTHWTICPVVSELYDLITISCYVGALKAISYGYSCLVTFLLEVTIKRLRGDDSTRFPVTIAKIEDMIIGFNVKNT